MSESVQDASVKEKMTNRIVTTIITCIAVTLEMSTFTLIITT